LFRGEIEERKIVGKIFSFCLVELKKFHILAREEKKVKNFLSEV